MTLNAARAAASARHGDIAKGVDVGALRKDARTSAKLKAMTLSDAYERFLDLKDRRVSTVKDYNLLWRLHVPERLKRKPIADITSSDVENLKIEIGRKKPRTANKVVVLLSAVMSKCGRWADNPARGVARFEERIRTRRLNADELARLWKVLDATEEDLWADLFKVLIVTGARRKALCSMRWQDLDLTAGIWVIPAIWSKNRRELAIPLTSVAVNVLQRRQSSCGRSQWVWPSEKSRIGHVVNPEKPWKAFLKTADIKESVSLHDVRRTLGSNLAKSGATAAIISKRLDTCRRNRHGPMFISTSSQHEQRSTMPLAVSAMPRKRRLTRLSSYDIPANDIDPRFPVEDPVLVRHALVDFDELALIPNDTRDQLISDLVDAVRFARAGVNAGKRGLSDKSLAQQIFLSDVARALERAGLPAKRWRKRYDRGDEPTANAPESLFFRLAREVAEVCGIVLPMDLKLLSQRAWQHQYGVMSAAMAVAQNAELAEKRKHRRRKNRRARPID
jgi:integrase